jgi:hypothetical protein
MTQAAVGYTVIGDPQICNVTCTRGKQFGNFDHGGLTIHIWSYKGKLSFGPKMGDSADLLFSLSNDEAKDQVSLQFVVERIKDNSNCFGYRVKLANDKEIAKSGVSLTMVPNFSKYFHSEKGVFIENGQIEEDMKNLTHFITSGGAQRKDDACIIQ